MGDKLFTLAEVLQNLNLFKNRSYSLYLPANRYPWSEDAPCAVLEHDEYDESDPLPEFAAAHGLQHTLSFPQITEIVENARLQLRDVSKSDLVRAFNYY